MVVVATPIAEQGLSPLAPLLDIEGETMQPQLVAAIGLIGVGFLAAGAYLIREGEDANRTFVALLVLAGLLVSAIALI